MNWPPFNTCPVTVLQDTWPGMPRHRIVVQDLTAAGYEAECYISHWVGSIGWQENVHPDGRSDGWIPMSFYGWIKWRPEGEVNWDSFTFFKSNYHCFSCDLGPQLEGGGYCHSYTLSLGNPKKVVTIEQYNAYGLKGNNLHYDSQQHRNEIDSLSASFLKWKNSRRTLEFNGQNWQWGREELSGEHYVEPWESYRDAEGKLPYTFIHEGDKYKETGSSFAFWPSENFR